MLLLIQHMCTFTIYNRCCVCSVKLLAHTCKPYLSQNLITRWRHYELVRCNNIKKNWTTIGDFIRIFLLYFVNILIFLFGNLLKLNGSNNRLNHLIKSTVAPFILVYFLRFAPSTHVCWPVVLATTSQFAPQTVATLA